MTPDWDSLPPLGLEAPAPFDTTFEIGPQVPQTKEVPIKALRKTTTIFVRVKNESQFRKAKQIITAALSKAGIDHNI